jgi:N-acetylglucosaminyl-diphospho-decaprenol L-rhamnosyltransferase
MTAPLPGQLIELTVPVVVVTHAGPTERVQRCMASLAEAGGARPIIVVDNSGSKLSDDGYEHADVTVIRTSNKGYGAAANIGFDTAWRLVPDAAAVALLNDDIEVDNDWLVPLTAAISGGASVAQPKLLQAPRSANPIINSVGVELDRCGAGIDIGYGQSDGDAFTQGRDIKIFTGGAVLFSRAFLESTGGFDERYFLYYEDVDLALRGGELGHRYRCEPSSTVWHEGGVSTGALGDETRRLQERNRLWCALRFAPIGVIGRATWLSVRRLRHAPRAVHAHAFWAGCSAAVRLVRARRQTRRQTRLDVQADVQAGPA